MPRLWSTRFILVLVLVLGTALRILMALLMGNDLRGLPGIEDQVSYDALGQSLASGNGWSFPRVWWPSTPALVQTSHWSFGYTAYLAGVYAMVGHQPVVARLLQAVLAGTLMPYLSYRLGRRVLGEKAGLVTAVLVACYAYFVYYAGALMTETFYIIAILWALDQAVQIGDGTRRPLPPGDASVMAVAARARPWLVLGLTLGAAALLRQVVLLFVPVLYAWLLWAAWKRPAPGEPRKAARWLVPRIGGLLATTFVLAAIVAPWALRNEQIFGRFVPLNTNAGFAFFWANHPIHGGNFQALIRDAQYQDLIPTELRGLDEAALDSALMNRGLQFVSDDPLRFALLSVSRFKDYFVFWPSPESSLVSNVGRALSYGIYLPFMLFGLILASGHRRQRSGIVLLCLFIGVYSLVHLLSWALIRYRLPVDAASMPFAALGLLSLGERLGKWRRSSASEPAKLFSDIMPTAPARELSASVTPPERL
jgi:4-amino-4-deoxy-L-arabinose transferase-like glycosyltransferase